LYFSMSWKTISTTSGLHPTASHIAFVKSSIVLAFVALSLPAYQLTSINGIILHRAYGFAPRFIKVVRELGKIFLISGGTQDKIIARKMRLIPK
jgi:hypothetical protein